MGLRTRRDWPECMPSQAETPLRLSVGDEYRSGEPGFCFDTNDETESGQTPPTTKNGKQPLGQRGIRSGFRKRTLNVSLETTGYKSRSLSLTTEHCSNGRIMNARMSPFCGAHHETESLICLRVQRIEWESTNGIVSHRSVFEVSGTNA